MSMTLKCICGKCNLCKSREYMRKRAIENPERLREIDRARYYRNWEKRRAAMDAYQKENWDRVLEHKKRWDEKNPEKKKAQTAANNAVRDGKLLRQPCEVCGTWERVQKHHDDYSKPLEVRWLCPIHHGIVTRKYEG